MGNIKCYILMFLCCINNFLQAQSFGVGINLSQAVYRAISPEQANFFMPSIGFSIAKSFKVKENHHLVTGLDLLNFTTGMRTERDFGDGASAYLMTRPRVSVFQVPLAYVYRFKPTERQKSLHKFIRSGLNFQTLKTSGHAGRTSLKSPSVPNINGTGTPYSASARILTSSTDNRIFNVNPFIGLGGYYKLDNGKYLELSANTTFLRNVPVFSASHIVNSEVNFIEAPKSAFLISLKANYFFK
jgi:hypothetical protein